MHRLALPAIALAAMAVPAPAQLPALVDAENATIDPASMDLTDNGRTFLFSRERARADLADFGRRGVASVAYLAQGGSPSAKQRAEHRLGGQLAPGAPTEVLHDGFTKYVAFSLMLDPTRWTAPNTVYEWFNIHQVKQAPWADPWMLLQFRPDGSNTLRLQVRQGRNPSTWTATHVDTIPLATGVWYDVVVGWRFDLSRPRGSSRATDRPWRRWRRPRRSAGLSARRWS